MEEDFIGDDVIREHVKDALDKIPLSSKSGTSSVTISWLNTKSTVVLYQEILIYKASMKTF
jgi:hypothetical protein